MKSGSCSGELGLGYLFYSGCGHSVIPLSDVDTIELSTSTHLNAVTPISLGRSVLVSIPSVSGDGFGREPGEYDENWSGPLTNPEDRNHPRGNWCVKSITSTSVPDIADSIVKEFNPLTIVDVGYVTEVLLEQQKFRGVESLGIEHGRAAVEHCRVGHDLILKNDQRQPLLLHSRFDLAPEPTPERRKGRTGFPRLPSRRARRDRISLIMPTRNEGGNVRKTIESLLENTFYPDYEVLILDDASDDGSCDFLLAPPYADDERLRLIRSDSKKGHLALRIEGARLATGSVLQFLDSHHWFGPYWLTNLYDCLRRHDFQVLVGPVVSILDPVTWRPAANTGYADAYGWNLDTTLEKYWTRQRHMVGPGGRVNCLSGHQVMLARRVYDDFGGMCPLYRGHGTDDFDFCLRAFLFGYDSILEPTATIAHLHKDYFTSPVTWLDLHFNYMIFVYLNLGEERFEQIKATRESQFAYPEILELFETLRPQVDQFRGWIVKHKRRSAEELLESLVELDSQSPPFYRRVEEIGAQVGNRASDRVRAVEMKTVSIIITTHNEGDHLRRTVESILANTTWSEFEVVLIDDGSSDGSLDFLHGEPYCSDARLRCFRNEQPAGLIRARHEGVRRARGDYFVILDAHTAVLPGWLAMLAEAAERWGPFAAITPNIAVLDEESWSHQPSTGQFLTINESLDMVWLDPACFAGTVPTFQGGCWFMPRQFYFQVGGLDLGLRRWGCEFIDLSFKIYAGGGACYYEPSVVVGHLFRSAFPYPMRYVDLTYNKLRTGYVHLPERSFGRLLDNLRDEPGFSEAMVDIQADLSELNHLRRVQGAANRRDPDWFVRTFLPGLLDKPGAPHSQTHWSSNGKDNDMIPKMQRTICPKCGATNVGVHLRCLICQAVLPLAGGSEPPRQPPSARIAHNFCIQCGAPIQPGRQFCTECGRKL